MMMRLLLASILLAWAAPATARLELSAEEREIVQFFGAANAATFSDRLSNVTGFADEALQRLLLIDACPVKPGTQRFVTPKYIAMVLDAARLSARIIEDDLQANGYLAGDWETAAVYAWRRWDQKQRQEWLAYMRSPEGKRGYVGYRYAMAIEEFHRLTTDIGTDQVMPSVTWPGWLGEFVMRAGLDKSFRRAANTLEPGLGDRFLEEAAKPLADPPTDAQRKVLGDLTLGVAKRWADLSKAMLADMGQADAATRRDADAWEAHALAKEVEDIMFKVMTRVEGDPALSAFLVLAGQGEVHRNRRQDQLWEALRPRIKALCEALK